MIEGILRSTFLRRRRDLQHVKLDTVFEPPSVESEICTPTIQSSTSTIADADDESPLTRALNLEYYECLEEASATNHFKTNSRGRVPEAPIRGSVHTVDSINTEKISQQRRRPTLSWLSWRRSSIIAEDSTPPESNKRRTWAPVRNSRKLLKRLLRRVQKRKSKNEEPHDIQTSQ